MMEIDKSDSRFSNLEKIPLDGPFALEASFRADTDERKVNLGIGVYRDDEGKSWSLSSVLEAKKRMKIETLSHGYLPLHGSDEFIRAARELLLGNELLQQINEAVTSVQTVSGTGANSLIARFLGRHLRPTNVWLPDPTWDNHFRIWKENAPNVRQKLYPYYNSSTRSFDFNGMTQLIRETAQPNDVILLHACAHNPTGLDPSKEQWLEIAKICEEKQLFVVFDAAYQGFASGDGDHDAWAVRQFLSSPGIELAICQSFSKNLGLYGERAGALHIAVSRVSHTLPTGAVRSQLIQLQRADISMPPLFGVRIAAQVLSDQELHAMWTKDLAVMSGRIKAMRKALYEALVALETPGDWHHIIQQTGMFSYTGLTVEQVELLKQKHHIYMLSSGRASICGLTSRNVKYVAQAIHDVVVGKMS